LEVLKMDIGELVYTYKGKTYTGKSNITHKALYNVIYTIFFYKEGEKILGSIAGIDFTFSKSFHNKSEMNKFLKELSLK
jgi:hypothetical protein